ncbi:MAG: hypothetical protein DRK00_11545, partial [Thermoprotei archaeon]
YYTGNWEDKFPKLVEEARKKAGKKAVSKLAVLLDEYQYFLHRLNAARNAAQHHAVVLETEARVLVSEAKEFVAKFVELCYNLRLEELSYADLLSTPDFRRLAEEAEEALREGRYEDAVDKAIDLLTLITFGNEKYQGLVGLAGQLTGLFSPYKETLKAVLKEDYYKQYQGQARKLAKALTEVAMSIGAASTTMQFLNRGEKATFLRLMTKEGWRDEEAYAKAMVHFAIMFAWRIETLSLAELLPKK